MKFIALALLLLVSLIQAGVTVKEIPDLVALGYTVQGSTPISGDYIHYDVSWGATFLADLAIRKNNEEPGVLAVFNVQTDDDTRPEALPLRDIQLGVWVYSIGREAADLIAIKYLDVYEFQLVEVTHRVYELMNTPEFEDLIPGASVANHGPCNDRVYRNYFSENEGKAYALLHDETPFGNGAQKMIDEFAEMQGKKVEAFGYDAKASGAFHFTIYFQM